MTDAFGFRAVFSVLLPGTNAVVEPDMAALRPLGVTNQSCRFSFPGLPDSVKGPLELMRPALDMVLACEPDRIVVAYSPEYMNDGVNGASELRRIFEERIEIPFTLASDAVSEALKALEVTRVGIVTPFLPEANRNVSSYFSAHGISVVSEAGFSSAQKGRAYTARISEAEVREAFERVDTPEVEALVQVGTALVCAGFVDALEARHGKPVVAANRIDASLLALFAFWLAQEMLCSIEQMGRIYGQMINEATVSAGQAVELMGGP
jgi:maleate isomerase